MEYNTHDSSGDDITGTYAKWLLILYLNSACMWIQAQHTTFETLDSTTFNGGPSTGIMWPLIERFMGANMGPIKFWDRLCTCAVAERHFGAISSRLKNADSMATTIVNWWQSWVVTKYGHENWIMYKENIEILSHILTIYLPPWYNHNGGSDTVGLQNTNAPKSCLLNQVAGT